MSLVLTCQQWDEQAQHCAVSAWQEIAAPDPSFMALFDLPTVDQANQVFMLCFTIVLGANVLGYVVGQVVKMLSTERA